MVKLTKEEKKALKELKKLEKERQIIEQGKQIKRDELLREIKVQEVRREEIEERWRNIIMGIKIPEFRKDIQIMWHTFERAYDKKDFLIKHIQNLMAEAEDQYQRTVAAFCEIVDNAIHKFNKDLDKMKRFNDEKTLALLKRGDDDASKLECQKTKAETHLNVIMFQATTSYENYKWKVRGENMVKADEERDKLQDVRDHLRSGLEHDYTSLWDEYKATIKNYISNTSDNQKKGRRLRRKEIVIMDIIAAQSKQLASHDSNFRKLCNDLFMFEAGLSQQEFRQNRERHRAAYWRLKHALVDVVEQDTLNMSNLVECSNEAIGRLEVARTKGEKIVKYAELCRKLETQKEKVLPYGLRSPVSPILPDRDYKSTLVDRTDQPIDDEIAMANNALENTEMLQMFWQKIARAQMLVEALKREKAILLFQISKLQGSSSDRPFSMEQVEGEECQCESEKIENKKKVHLSFPVAIEASHVAGRLL